MHLCMVIILSTVSQHLTVLGYQHVLLKKKKNSGVIIKNYWQVLSWYCHISTIKMEATWLVHNEMILDAWMISDRLMIRFYSYQYWAWHIDLSGEVSIFKFVRCFSEKLDFSKHILSIAVNPFLFSCDQAALWMVQSVCPSVRLSVCLSVRHTFLTMLPSSYHHEIFRSYHQGPG